MTFNRLQVLGRNGIWYYSMILVEISQINVSNYFLSDIKRQRISKTRNKQVYDRANFFVMGENFILLFTNNNL